MHGKKEHEIAIIEMGATHPLEIKELSTIPAPNYGIITNIGMAHIEGFGSFDVNIGCYVHNCIFSQQKNQCPTFVFDFLDRVLSMRKQ